jgi:hypothetical protein
MGSTVRRAWPLLGALAAAAALLDLGGVHRLEHGDSLVPVLVSLQRWTPLYWDQERFGMLVPLLAMPVRDPLWNLLLQRGLMILAGLSTVVLLARHLLAERDWPLCGAAAAATLLLFAPEPWRFEFLGDQPYGLALALALAGLAFAEPAAHGSRRPRWRLAVGLLLVLLAHLVNPATGVVLGLLALGRALEDWFTEPAEERGAVRERLLVDAGLLAAGLVAGQLSIMLYPVLTGKPLLLAVGFLPLAEWPGAWAATVARAWAEAPGWGWALLATIGLGGALLALPSSRGWRRDALIRAGMLGGAALAYAAFVGALAWVAENHHHPRYLAPAAVLLHLAAVSLVAEPLARAVRAAGPAFLAALLALPLAAVAVGGPPSLARVRADLDAVAGAFTEDVLAARCQLVAGDYWSVWPAVWHAALVARERRLLDEAGSGPRRVWGVTHRSTPTVLQWKGIPAALLRICRPHGEAPEREAERWLRAYHAWPVRVVERRKTVDVLVLAPPLE